MIRQTGLALGVAILVAVLGTAASGSPDLSAFRQAWWVTALIALAGIFPAAVWLTRRPAVAVA